MKRLVLTIVGVLIFLTMIISYCYFRATGDIILYVNTYKTINIPNAEYAGVVYAVLTDHTHYVVFLQDKDSTHALHVDSLMWTKINVHDTISCNQ